MFWVKLRKKTRWRPEKLKRKIRRRRVFKMTIPSTSPTTIIELLKCLKISIASPHSHLNASVVMFSLIKPSLYSGCWKPCTNLVARYSTFSRRSICFSSWGDRAHCAYSKCECTKEENTFLKGTLSKWVNSTFQQRKSCFIQENDPFWFDIVLKLKEMTETTRCIGCWGLKTLEKDY